MWQRRNESKIMAPKFGTSGLRGLVVELTADLVEAHVAAFIQACPVGTGLFVGRDLRPSSPDIAGYVIAAARARGVDVTDCGDILTPGLALAAMSAGASAVMITGSHIPADRNGLKFYTPEGEISKAHEAAILAELGNVRAYSGAEGSLSSLDAEPAYIKRYVDAFGARALSGMHIGVYTHSTVGRDVMIAILERLGAKTADLGRSETFIPVDTEAVAPDVRAQLKEWSGPFDAIVSMDGDGDRPLVTDARGDVVPGDILGQITAKFLGAEAVVTPISSNTGVTQLGFGSVVTTRIGSPFVIAGMEETGGKVVGYEANGGFLMGFDGLLPPLMTRDAVLPIVATLAAAKVGGIEDLIANQPECFTAADRLQETPTEVSKALVVALQDDASPFLSPLDGTLSSTDLTDGLRMTLTDGRVVHLRPSGNAPELRCYVEDKSKERAQETLSQALGILRELTSKG